MKRFLNKISKIFVRSLKNDLNYKEIEKMMKEDKNIKLIDVRSLQEYKEEHLKGAINISVYEMQNKVENIVKDKNSIIIVYCKSGKRSMKAKLILENLGYKNVYNMEGGLDNVNL